MTSLLLSPEWDGMVLLFGTLVLTVLFSAQFIRGLWQRDRQNRLHLFPRPHISVPSRARH
ncbi:MAG: hypothetical protein QM765_30050 [Myxococcales bacterium]